MIEIRETVDRMLADAPDDTTAWASLRDGGFAGVGVPEERGGSGGSLDDAQVVLELTAYHHLEAPLAETTWLASWLLTSAGRDGPAGTATAAAAELAVTAGRVTGRLVRVPFAADVEEIVALGDGFLARLDPAECQFEPGVNLAGEDRSDVVLDGAPAQIVPTTVTPEQLLLRGALARSVQISGAARRALDHALQYAGERRQFGRAIARFQAVQHLLADLASEVFVLDVSSRAAVAAVGTSTERLAIAAAKQNASTAAARVASIAHQVHGAIGVTHEYDLRFTTTRLWAWSQEFGNADAWAARIGEWSTDQSDLWAWLTTSPEPTTEVRA